MPFGEYVPWRSFFSHLANLQAIPRDAIAGHGSGMMATPAAKLAVLVSYEVFFPDRGRSGVRAGGELARRADEHVLVLERAGARPGDRRLPPAGDRGGTRPAPGRPDGLLGVIDNHGTVLQQTRFRWRPSFAPTVPLRDGTTLYTRFGDGPPWRSPPPPPSSAGRWRLWERRRASEADRDSSNGRVDVV